MKRLLKKLRQSRGETLIETLVAVLVMTCASVLLATMLLAASNLNGKAQEQDQNFYKEITVAETQAEPKLSILEVQVKEGSNPNPVARIEATLYGTENGLISYKWGASAS